MNSVKLFIIATLFCSGVSYEAGRQIGLPLADRLPVARPAATNNVSSGTSEKSASPAPTSPTTDTVAAAPPTDTLAPSPAVTAVVPPNPKPVTQPPINVASVVSHSSTAQTGYPNLYSYGQCTYYVAKRRSVPPLWGNANAWFANAQASGWAVGSIPRTGAIAWTGEGSYGHVAIVEAVNGTSVYLSEMNYNGNWNRVTYRWASANAFRYIY